MEYLYRDIQSTLANYTPIICTHWINAHFLAARGFCPTLYSAFTYISPHMCLFSSSPALTQHNRPSTMQDAISPDLPQTSIVRTTVRLSANIPYPRRRNTCVNDIQRKALRIFASDTHPKPTQKACVAWFKDNSAKLLIVQRSLASFHLNMII
jgi:hypothetical protein